MLLVQKVAILGHDGLRVLTVQLESIIHILDDLIVSHALQVASLEKVGAIVLAVLLEDIDMAMGVVLFVLMLIFPMLWRLRSQKGLEQSEA